jgi:hypothetical protein
MASVSRSSCRTLVWYGTSASPGVSTHTLCRDLWPSDVVLMEGRVDVKGVRMALVRVPDRVQTGEQRGLGYG